MNANGGTRMNKFIEEHGKLVATGAVAFAIGYSLIHCDLNSYVSGFASGVAAFVAFALWLED